MTGWKSFMNFFIVCICIFALPACSGIIPEQEPGPVEVAVDTSLEDVTGGIRLAPPESRWDGYGEAVAVRGEHLVVGAPEWNQLGPGSAYVYRRAGDSWQEEIQLVASDREEGQLAQRFGNAVAIADGIIAVGAPGNDDPIVGENSGAVYIFEYQDQTWIESAKLKPEKANQAAAPVALKELEYNRTRPRAFGALVALDGDMLAVGGDPEGLLYLYRREANGWQKQANIQIPHSPGSDLYMASIALSGDALAVSIFYALPQPEEVPLLLGNVVVHMFERSGDTWQDSLQFTPEGQQDILFLREVNIGASVALESTSGGANLLAIGLPGFPDWSEAQDNSTLFGVNPSPLEIPVSNRQAGAVYLFERTENEWIQRSTLRPAGWEDPPGAGSFPMNAPSHLDEGSEDAGESGALAANGIPQSFIFPGHIFSANPEISFFGATLDFDGNLLAITAGYANTTYVFERTGQAWTYRFSLKPTPTGEVWEDSAQVVAVSGHTLLLGTPSEFGNSAYVFDICAPQMLLCK